MRVAAVIASVVLLGCGRVGYARHSVDGDPDPSVHDVGPDGRDGADRDADASGGDGDIDARSDAPPDALPDGADDGAEVDARSDADVDASSDADVDASSDADAAPTCVPESCNGVNDDCDAFVDEASICALCSGCSVVRGIAGPELSGIDLATDDAGEIWLAGQLNGTADFGGGPVTFGGTTGFIVEYDATGAFLSIGQQVANRSHYLDIDDDPMPELYFGYFDAAGIACHSTPIATTYCYAAIDVVGVGAAGGRAVFAGDSNNTSDAPVMGTEAGYFVSYDDRGTRLAPRVIDGTGAVHVHEVAIDPSGGVCVAGTFVGTVDFGGGGRIADPITASSGFVACYTSAAAYRWDRVFTGGPYAFEGLQIDAVVAIAVGSFSGNAVLDGTSRPSAGGLDGFVAVLDYATGSTAAALTWGAAGRDVAYGIVARSSRVEIVGAASPGASVGGTTFDDERIFFAAYDYGLRTVAIRSLSGTTYPTASAFAIDLTPTGVVVGLQLTSGIPLADPGFAAPGIVLLEVGP